MKKTVKAEGKVVMKRDRNTGSGSGSGWGSAAETRDIHTSVVIGLTVT